MVILYHNSPTMSITDFHVAQNEKNYKKVAEKVLKNKKEYAMIFSYF